MSLIEEIDDELKDAMRARDAERRDALRLILNALKNSQKELQRPLSEEEELQVLQRERKRRVEAAEAFRNGGREELVLVDRPRRGYGDDYSPWLVDAPVGELVRVRGASVTEEGIVAA